MSARPLSAATALALLAACASSHAATRSWQVTDFSRLRVEGPFDVRVHTGAPAAVRATGPQAAIDRLEIEQRGDTLVVRATRMGTANWSWGKGEPLVVDVATHALAAAALAGSGNVSIDRIRGDAIDLSLTGAGDLTVADMDVASAKLLMNGTGDLGVKGRARHADVTLLGAGDIHGRDLAVEAATAKLVGSGDLELGATRTATIDLTGSGDATISGPAACTVHRSGSGDVHCAKGGSSGD